MKRQKKYHLINLLTTLKDIEHKNYREIQMLLLLANVRHFFLQVLPCPHMEEMQAGMKGGEIKWTQECMSRYGVALVY